MKMKQNKMPAYLKNSSQALFFILLIPFYLLFLTTLILRNGNEDLRDYIDGI